MKRSKASSKALINSVLTSFPRSTPPIRAAYRRLGQAAIKPNDSFIRPKTHQQSYD